MGLCHPVGQESRPLGCLKLKVIFRQKATNYRALLRKMTHKDKASYGFLPPCRSRVKADSLSLGLIYVSFWMWGFIVYYIYDMYVYMFMCVFNYCTCA